MNTPQEPKFNITVTATGVDIAKELASIPPELSAKISKIKTAITQIAKDIASSASSIYPTWHEIVLQTWVPDTCESCNYFINELIVESLKKNMTEECQPGYSPDIVSCIWLLSSKLAFYGLANNSVPLYFGGVKMEEPISRSSVKEKLRTLINIGYDTLSLLVPIFWAHEAWLSIWDDSIDTFLVTLKTIIDRQQHTQDILNKDTEFVHIAISASQYNNFLWEYIGYEIWRSYPSIITPELWLRILKRAPTPEIANILMKKIPVVWSEEIIQQNTKPSSIKNHRKINGYNIQVIDGVRKLEDTENRLRMGEWENKMYITRYYRMKFHDQSGKPYLYATMSHNSECYMDEIYEIAPTSEELTASQKKAFLPNLAFPNIYEIYQLDKQYWSDWVEWWRSDHVDKYFTYDLSRQLTTKTVLSTMEDTANIVTAVTDASFVSPIDHNKEVVKKLDCVIKEDNLELWTNPSEFSWMEHYTSSHKSRNRIYINKFALLIENFKNRFEHTDDWKVVVSLFRDSSYVAVNLADNKWSIFISDVENCGTQVFAQTVDPAFLKNMNDSDNNISMNDLGELFGPWTTVPSNSMNPNDPASVHQWISNISKALEKSSNDYFLDLQWWTTIPVTEILWELYQIHAINDGAILSVSAFKQYLDAYNAHLRGNTRLTSLEKKKKALLNKKWASLDVWEAITALGWNPYFLRYHWHNKIFKDYLTYLLQWKIEDAHVLFEKFRREHVIWKKLKDYLDVMHASSKKITIEEFSELFNGNSIEKQVIKDTYTIPHWLFTVTSWLIALGEDPTKNIQGETKEDYLIRILNSRWWFN